MELNTGRENYNIITMKAKQLFDPMNGVQRWCKTTSLINFVAFIIILYLVRLIEFLEANIILNTYKMILFH